MQNRDLDEAERRSPRAVLNGDLDEAERRSPRAAEQKDAPTSSSSRKQAHARGEEENDSMSNRGDDGVNTKGTGASLSQKAVLQEELSKRSHVEARNLDCMERTSSKFINASLLQRVGKAFFQSLVVKSAFELSTYPVQDALGQAVVAEELIDLQMILDEMGAEAHSKVAGRDKYGRTAIHLAALGNSPRIITCLLESFARQTQRQLEEDIYKLDSDRFGITTELKKTFAAASGDTASPLSSLDKHPRVLVVQEWFQRELVRKRRQAEIRIEVWWAKLLTTKDCFGRTPLHYAVGRDAPLGVLQALITSGRSHMNGDANSRRAASGRGSQKIFNKSSVYDSTSGLEIVDFGGAAAEPSLCADDKSPCTDASSRHAGSFSSTLGVRNIAWELGSTLGLRIAVPTAESAAAESFEVVVPWVMRNVVRRAAERGSREEVSALHALDSLVKATVSQPSSIILVPELRALLALLGIRVTNEVLREMCRRYPADIDVVRDKWARVQEEQEEEASDIRRAGVQLERLRSTLRRKDGRGDKQDRDDAVAEEKSSSRISRSQPSSKREDDDDHHHRRIRGDEAGGKESADDKGSGRSGLESLEAESIKRNSRAISERNDKLLLMDPIDSERGVDFHLMFADLKEGRGLQSLDFKAMSVTSSALEQGISNFAGKDESKRQEIVDLLSDGGSKNQARGISSADAEQAMEHDMPSSQTAALAQSGRSLEYAACVSVSSIGRARRAVVNVCDDFGRSPLLVASALGQNSQVACLLSHGGDISLSAPEGHSALSLASGSTTRSLLEKALVAWLNEKDACLLGGSDKRLVEIKRDDSFLESLRLGSSSRTGSLHARGDQSNAITRNAKSRLEERSNLVLGLTAQLRQLSQKNWSYSRTPLSWAVNNGLLAVVEQLLGEGTSPNSRDTVNRTPLHECVALIGNASGVSHMDACLQVAEALLEAGADVDAASISGRRPLHELFCRGQDEAVSSFARVSHGHKNAIYHVTGSACSPQLVSNYRRMLLKKLLEFGADPTLLDRQGMSPMHYCARENNAGCMLEILRRCHNPGTLTARKQTCLHIACKAGAREVVHILCRWDGDSRPGHGLMHQRDAQGKVALAMLPSSCTQNCTDTLWRAARQGNVTKCQELLSKMKMAGDALWEDMEGSAAAVATNASLAVSQNSSISSCMPDEGGGGGDAAQELWLFNGVDAKSRRMRWTSLHACIVGWAEMEATLGSKGVTSHERRRKPNLCAQRALGLPALTTSPSSGDGSPPRSVAGTGLFAETLALLLQVCVSLLFYVFMAAPILNSLSYFLPCLQNHAFVDSIDCNGRSALMLAAAANLTAAVEMLLEAEADVRHGDLDGRQCLHLAYATGAASCIVMLEKCGADTDARDSSRMLPLDCAGKISLVSHLFG